MEETGRMVSISSFITMLRDDIVKFVFEKKDGSTRIAFGTRNPKIIAAIIGTVDAKSGTKRPPREGFVTYFDMEKESFRCFAEERFMGVIEEHAIYTPASVSENRVLGFEEFSLISEALDCCYDEEDCDEEE